MHARITTIQIGLARTASVVRQLCDSGVRSARSILLVSCAAFLMGSLAGCVAPPPPPPAPALVCVDFEPPLTAGTRYGQPAGQKPGDVIFTPNGIPVAVWDFVWTNGGGTFGTARIEPAQPAFGQGQIINTNNINLEFDFTALGFTPGAVTFDFLDMGGFENLSVNGSPVFAGELAAAPAPAGFTISVNAAPVPGGKKGTVTITGPVKTLRIGGQEFWLDNVCAHTSPPPTPAPALVCVDFEPPLVLGTQYGSPVSSLPVR